MVDFDTAAAAVQDPNADPVLLAKIAYEIQNSARMWLPIRVRTLV